MDRRKHPKTRQKRSFAAKSRSNATVAESLSHSSSSSSSLPLKRPVDRLNGTTNDALTNISDIVNYKVTSARDTRRRKMMKIRCRSSSSTAIKNDINHNSLYPVMVHSPDQNCRSILLPVAVYRPASLFAMLLVASLLPKNTFSLRWLALGGAGFRSSPLEAMPFITRDGSGLMTGRSNNKKGAGTTSLLGRDVSSSTWVALAVDPEMMMCMSCDDDVNVDSCNSDLKRLWKDAVQSVEESIIVAKNAKPNNDVSEMDWSEGGEYSIAAHLFEAVPRGGDLSSNGGSRYDPPYAGLINLGNTCYLNSQLQCAYHVPLLRKLVLEARDEVVEVEVKVEVEIDDDEGKEEEVSKEEENAPENAENCETENEKTETSEATSNDADEAEQAEQTPPVQVDQDTFTAEAEANTPSESPQEEPKKKKTIIKTETRKELRPISQALRALQHTFRTLTPSNGNAPAGTTHALCRTLGINPFIQQDGQEFWKLFVPEVDYAKLSDLYSGYFEDYVREILPDDDGDSGNEEKKENESIIPNNDENDNSNNKSKPKPRERVRTEPFLDLSIPVSEGSSSSIQSTLREMFTQPEVLKVSEGNGWRPAKGEEKVDAHKGSSLQLEGLPSLLQLHLKRFKYDWETGETSKINDCCSFPLELDLSEIVESNEGKDTSNVVYDLQSIVIHKGEYGSGHYYSYCRPDIRNNAWYRFDDQFVTPVDFSEVIQDAYGGRVRRRRANSISGNSNPNGVKRQRGILRRIFSFGRSGSGGEGGGFGYGGRSSSAYMLQYVRRSDIPKLYLE